MVPGVSYRHLRPVDLEPLKLLHQRLFPLDYDGEFFTRSVHGLDGIVGFGALVAQRSAARISVGPDLLPHLHQEHAGQGSDDAELLAGFITARAFPAQFADPHDLQLLGLASPAADSSADRLLYVLTLGVHEAFQHRGIARHLLDLVLRHAAEAHCRAVYLHVASFNQAALSFYRRAGFKECAVLPDFYTIRTGRQPVPHKQRYDACLFGCIIAPSPPTPWDAANLAVVPLTAVIDSLGLNACFPWGGTRRSHHAAALQGAAAAAAGGAGAGVPGGSAAGAKATRFHIEEVLEGGTSLPGVESTNGHNTSTSEQQQRFGEQADGAHPANGSCDGSRPQRCKERWDALQPVVALQQQSPASMQPGSSPDWLRNLFTRR